MKSAQLSTYAVEVVTSCQVLVMFCFSSLRGVMPSFLLISASCLSLDASTWDRVWISSSTYTHTHTHTDVIFDSTYKSVPQHVKSGSSSICHYKKTQIQNTFFPGHKTPPLFNRMTVATFQIYLEPVSTNTNVLLLQIQIISLNPQ